MKKILILIIFALVTAAAGAEEKAVAGVLTGHSASVTSLACSPSGKYLASSSEDKTIRIWLLAEKRCEMVLTGHLEPVWTVSYSPDGKYMASASDDNTVRIWDTSDGKCVKILTGHTKYVVAAAFSPDGQYVASGSMDKSVKIWRMSDSECTATFSQHTDPVTAISYSPNGRFIADASGQVIKIWEIGNGNCVNELTGHSDSVTSVIFSPNGKYLASAGGQTIKIWRTADGECIGTLTGHENDIKDMSYSPSGEYIVSCDESGKIKIWDAISGQNLRTIAGSGETDSICFSNDGRYIFVGYKRGVIEIRKFSISEEAPQQVSEAVTAPPPVPSSVPKRAGEKPKPPKKETPPAAPKAEAKPEPAIETQPAAATANATLAAGSTETGTAGELLNQKTPAPEEQGTQPGSNKSPMLLITVAGIVLLFAMLAAFFFTGLSKAKYAALPKRITKNVAEGRMEHAAELFIKYQKGFLNKKPDIKKLPPETLFRIYQHHNMLDNLFRETFPAQYTVSFTKLLIESKKYEKAYEMSKGFSLQELTADEIFAMYTAVGKANDITPGTIPISYFLDYAKTVLERGGGEQAYKLTDKYREYIFDGKTFGKETYIFSKDHKHSVSAVCFTPDSSYMATASLDKTIKIWQMETKKCVKTLDGNPDWIYSVAYSPNGKLLIGGLGNGTIKVWAADNYECIKSLEAHKDSVMSLAFSRDGKFFLSGSADSTIKIWDTDNAECVKTLRGHTGWVKTAEFSPDGDKFVVSGSADNTLKIWNIATGENVMTLQGHKWGGVNSISFSNDGKYLASASDDKTVKIWQVGNYECVKTIEGHKDNVLTAAFSNDDNYIVSGSADRTIKIWLAPGFELIKTMEGNGNSVMAASFSPDGRYIATGNADQTVKVWELNSILAVDENIVGKAFEIYKKSGNLENLCSYIAKEKVNPKIYNIISELLYKADESEKAQAVLKAKQNFYSTNQPAQAVDGRPGSGGYGTEKTGPGDALPEKYHEEFVKSLKSLENENKEN